MIMSDTKTLSVKHSCHTLLLQSHLQCMNHCVLLYYMYLPLTLFTVSVPEIKGFKKGSGRHTVHYLQRGQVHRCSHEGNGEVFLCLSAFIDLSNLNIPVESFGLRQWLIFNYHSLSSFLCQTIVAEHEIRNISCAAQDPDDLCTFAYITKDLKSGHHFCHVFSTVEVVSNTFLHR